jgi:minor extracellular serine protease Vpr
MKNLFKTKSTLPILMVLCFLTFKAYNQQTNGFLIVHDNEIPLFDTTTKVATTNFSVTSRMLLHKIKGVDFNNESTIDTNLFKELNDMFGVHFVNNQSYVGALVHVGRAEVESKLEELEIKVGTKAGSIWSMQIPLKVLNSLKELKELIYVDVDTKASPQLDNARSYSYVDQVHNGTSLPQQYKGNNVVVGIVDMGFDYTHPTFNDSNTLNTRIKRAWSQMVSGTPPSSFTYGSEYTTSTSIYNAQTDNSGENHGSHVAGIAAGSGSAVTQYKGIAPSSEIVLVGSNGVISKLFDGVKYVFDYAQSVNKPAVVNLSWGGHLGPHDGTSLFDKAIDTLLLVKGRAIIGAAGNEGADSIHVQYNFGSTASWKSSFIKDGNGSFTNYTSQQKMNFWGDSGSSFYVEVEIFDINGNYIGATNYISTSSNSFIDTTISNVDIYIGVKKSNPYNNKPNAGVFLANTTGNKVVQVSVWSQNNIVHGWSYYPLPAKTYFVNYFPSLGVQSSRTSGNTNFTISEIGGTGNKIISVGAYNTKNSWTNLANQTMTNYDSLNEIANFSSKGPTIDGRTKPDITAPGNLVISSVNSFNGAYKPSGSKKNLLASKYVYVGSNTWYFGVDQGTSMAAPVVTGIVALMLEANPNLKADQIKQILKNRAYSDSYTGTIPSTGSNSWGWGKANAWYSVADAYCYGQTLSVNISDPLTFCSGGSTTISIPSKYYNIQWSDSDTSRIRTFSTPQTLYFTAQDQYCNYKSQDYVISVNPTPNTGFTVNNLNQCLSGNNFIFNDTTKISSGTLTRTWYFGDATNSTNNPTTKTYNTANVYSVKLISISNNGCKDSFTKAVTVNPQPNATATAASPTTFCQGESVTISANTGAGFKYQWRNNGKNISGAINPDFIASTNGNYRVVITNIYGCYDSSSSINVTVNPIPEIPLLTANGATSFCEGGNVTLSTSLTGVNYQWLKDNVIISGANSASINASTSGNYTLAVSNAYNCKSSSMPIIVNVFEPPLKPVITLLNETLFSSATSGNQWYKDAVIISGATAALYIPTQSGQYSTLVTNLNNCKTESDPFDYVKTGYNDLRLLSAIIIYPNPTSGQVYIEGDYNYLEIRVYNSLGDLVIKKDSSSRSIDLSPHPDGIYHMVLVGSNQIMTREIVLLK